MRNSSLALVASVWISVPDPLHVDVDPEPRIHASDSVTIGPDPAVFVIDLQDANKKIIKSFFCLLLFEGTFTSYIKDTKSNRSH
jgi:hypothetical protein